MKRFAFYLLLVPIISPLVKIVIDSLSWPGSSFAFILIAFKLLLLRPGVFLFNAYLGWLWPALAIAIADRFVRSNTMRQLGIIGAVGFVSALVALVAQYVPSPSRWQWAMLVPGLACAITAVTCRLLLDLNRGHCRELGTTVYTATNVLRQWRLGLRPPAGD